jgi:hypothetical protein
MLYYFMTRNLLGGTAEIEKGTDFLFVYEQVVQFIFGWHGGFIF